MVKPSQPKGIKPKVEMEDGALPEIGDDGGGGINFSGQQLIIINTVITVLICSLFLGGTFLIVNGALESQLSHFKTTMASHGGEEGGEHGEKPQRGIILDLGEFILNLSDPDAKRYLKVNVALELSRAAHDPVIEGHGGHGGHGGYGGGGSGGPKKPTPLEIIEKEMQQYKPAIRDAIISVLSSKTAEELSSLAGKDLAKEQIKEAIDPIFAGEREVMRVSFGAFIIQ